MNTMRYARVALPIPLGRAFSYALPPDENAHDYPPGQRVIVPLGRRKVLGVVIDHHNEIPEGIGVAQIKTISMKIDDVPALTPELLSFLKELARYYIAPLGEVLRLALPALERATAREAEKIMGKKLKAVGRLVQIASLCSPAPEHAPPRGQALGILEELRKLDKQELTQLTAKYSNARAVCKKLQSLGFITLSQVQKQADPFLSENLERDTPPTLNPDQRQAVEDILQALEGKRTSKAFLLDGVTGSGKTEVYLHGAQAALAAGKSSLILVPEIALPPHLVPRFSARLGHQIAVLHSGLSEQARQEMWGKIRQGELRVVIGARSALFAPVRNLGLICIDEEHDSSYKQEEGVRYNARDMALLRAYRSDAVTVLGSATPSLQSEFAVRRGKLQRLRLPQRAHQEATLPQVELIDLKRFGPGPSGDALLSLPLHRAIEETLDQRGQIILFLNRRGFAPSLICSSCGQISECPNCSVPLTLHRRAQETLECHYCEFTQTGRGQCSSCGSKEFELEGTGTEKIESLLAESFPKAKVARLDRDVAAGLKSEKILNAMRAGEVDILIGTQMVTKGHDLPAVTLVGVLNADAALSLPDFRAAERTFQLLVQV
ncbi:MAG: primosomal protein N', partial [Polyangiaceae bacterium]|nr:primosomal protein N' [Polyangiaceae bacterium]